MTTIATRSISSRHEIPPKSINDRDRAANDVARPYWNFFLLICVALHVNNNIIINYKLILPCRYWECPPLHGISPADAASKTRGGRGGGEGPFYCDCTVCAMWICTWRRLFTSTSPSCCFKFSIFTPASCLHALDGWKTNIGEYMWQLNGGRYL